MENKLNHHHFKFKIIRVSWFKFLFKLFRSQGLPSAAIDTVYNVLINTSTVVENFNYVSNCRLKTNFIPNTIFYNNSELFLASSVPMLNLI
jgi:hypothetical protein